MELFQSTVPNCFSVNRSKSRVPKARTEAAPALPLVPKARTEAAPALPLVPKARTEAAPAANVAEAMADVEVWCAVCLVWGVLSACGCVYAQPLPVPHSAPGGQEPGRSPSLLWRMCQLGRRDEVLELLKQQGGLVDIELQEDVGSGSWHTAVSRCPRKADRSGETSTRTQSGR